jgi:hypothetical protein
VLDTGGGESTLTPGDVVNGGQGTDTLFVSVSGARGGSAITTSSVTLDSVEVVKVSNFATGGAGGAVPQNVFDTSLWTGVKQVELAASGSTGHTGFSNVANLVDARMAFGNGNLNIAYNASVVAGASDAQKLEVSGLTGGIFAANGIETLNITGTGSESKDFTVQSGTTGTATNNIKTVNVEGSAKVGFTITDNTVTLVDGSKATGALTINAAAAAGNKDLTIKGGSGDDVITATGFDSKDVIDGGTGSNTLNIGGSLTTAGSAAGVTNFQTLRVTNAQSNDPNLSLNAAIVGGTKTIQVAVKDIDTTVDSDHTLTITNFAADQSLVIRDTRATADNTTNGTVVSVALATDTTADTLNVTMQGQSMKTLTAGTFETVNLNASANSTGSSTANAIGTATLTAATSVKVTGSADLTINNLTTSATTTSGATRTFDASDATGKQTITFATSGNQTIKTGSGVDAITLVSGSLDSADVIDLGGGKDTLVAAGVTGALGVLQIKNTEVIELAFTGTAVSSLDLRDNTALTNLKLDSNNTDKAITVNRIASGTAVELVDGTNQNGNGETITLDYNTGATTGSVKVTTGSSATTYAGLTVTGISSLSIEAAGTSATTISSLGGSSSLTKLTLLGSKNIELTASSGTTGLAEIDASSVTGNVTLGSSFVRASGATVTTGSGADTINFSVTADGSAVINAAGGTDTLTLTGTSNIGTTKIDLSSATDQLTQVNGSANAAAQRGFENVSASGLGVGFGIEVTAVASSVITGSQNADTITANTSGGTYTGRGGNDVITLASSGSGVDTVVFAGGTGTAGSVARATTLGVDTITNFNTANDVFNFSEADFGDLNGGAGVAALDQAQVVLYSGTGVALNSGNAQIDGSGGITLTNGAFALVGTNTAGNTLALYFINSGATAGNTLAQEVSAGTAVKIADISIVGSALVLADFVGIA